MQRMLPILNTLPDVANAPDELVGHCKSGHEAVQLCVQLSHFSHEAICERLGIDKGHWSRIMQGRAHFPTDKRVALMRLCGNRAPLQYEAHELGLDLVEHNREDLIRTLQARVDRLEAA